MTQEEKVNLAKEWYNDPSTTKEEKSLLEKLFPKLAESEDGRMIKSLKRLIKAYYDVNFPTPEGFERKDMIAWLEKQGEKKHLSYPIKDYQGSFYCWNNVNDIRPKHLQRCICYDKYMEGVYCYVYDDISKYWCTQTTEEHDPNGDNHICDYADYRITMWKPVPDISMKGE